MAHREQDNRMDLSGSYHHYPVDLHSEATVKVGEYWYCDDVDPGFGSDNAFTLRKVKQWIPLVLGEEWLDGHLLKSFYSFPIGYRPSPPAATMWPIPSFSELQNTTVSVAARTNPSREDISLPTSIGELRDIPMLLQNAGNRALRAVAAGYLSWRFCLAPMVSDLRKLSDFTSRVQRRFQLLTRLMGRKSSTARVSLGNKVAQTNPATVVLHSEGAMFVGKRTVKYTRNEWATIRWKLLTQPPRDVESRYALSERLVAGITSYGALQTAWALQPWSWLADWFIGFSDWLKANNNTIPAIASGFCWMCTDVSETSYTLTYKPYWADLVGQHTEGETRKLRICPGTSSLIPPVPAMPALTAGTASILASLATLKLPIPKRFR